MPVVAVLLVTTVPAGCGGSDEDGSADDRAAVEQAVTGFYAALERRDGAKACAALTPNARREPQSIDKKHRPCERSLVALFGGGPRPTIAGVEIKGDEATVQLTGVGEGGNAVLVKRGDRWLLDGF